eukprot:2795633-Ditylum_brightwellii.AAC.1
MERSNFAAFVTVPRVRYKICRETSSQRTSSARYCVSAAEPERQIQHVDASVEVSVGGGGWDGMMLLLLLSSVDFVVSSSFLSSPISSKR